MSNDNQPHSSSSGAVIAIVTAAGMDLAEAAGHIQAMHGPCRIPTLLKRVDHHRMVVCDLVLDDE